MTIIPAEQAVLDTISDETPWALVETFSTQPRWMPADVNKGADIIVDYAKKLGLAVEVHEPTIHLSIPLSADVTIGGKTFRAKPPALSFPAPEGLTGPSLYIKANSKNLRVYSRDVRDIFGENFTDWDDFKARVNGRILLTEGFGNPALTSLVQEMGAAGLVVINPGKNIHWGVSSSVWGSPGIEDEARQPTIPVVAVNKEDGATIREMVLAGEPLTIRSDLQEGWFMQKVPVVTIPGTTEPDRFVLVHGHYDSWDVGVGDNATGDALLLGLADVLSRNRDHLGRTVKIAWWPGHSTGRYSGSGWYADRFGIELDENCVAAVNCDSPGCRWATSYHMTTCMSEFKPFVTEVITDITGTAPEYIRPKRAGDASFFNIGISSYYSLSSTMPEDLRKEKEYYDVSGCGGNIAWHTEDDQMEIADRGVFNTDLQIYTLSVLRHAGRKILPMDWRVTVDEFTTTLDKYEAAAGAYFDFAPLREATATLSAALNRLYAGIEDGSIAATSANDVLMGLSRVLVPLNFTRAPRFMQDPAIASPGLPGLSSAVALDPENEDLLNNVLTDLMRGANRYLVAMREARALIGTSLS